MQAYVRALLISLWVTAVLVTAPIASAYTITLNGGGTTDLLTRGNDKVDARVEEHVYPVGLSYAYTSTSIDGGASSQSTYGHSNDGFDITFNHSRTGTKFAEGRSWGYIYFSVDQNVSYSAAGAYSAVDPSGLLINLTGWLYDLDTGSYVFKSAQVSSATPNESFVLGGAGGDGAGNVVQVGSLTGMLLAGHEYQFWYDAYIQAWPSSGTAATSLGSISLDFTAIPEPSTGLLFGLGLIGMAATRGRGR
jgi:hypothetical protein